MKTISDIEATLTTDLQSTLKPLTPPGYRLDVHLWGKDRKKRHNACAESWSAESGKIVIQFTPDDTNVVPSSITSISATSTPTALSSRQTVAASEITELCLVLGEVERTGRSFIALKWFRDSILAGKEFHWTKTTEERQAVLAAAIDSGAVLTKKISNPKAPQFPTTTLMLNRSYMSNRQAASAFPRYAPVAVKGEALSETLLRDRGIR